MKEIDARGYACPRPVIMTKKAINSENLEEVLVRVDNLTATENLSKMAAELFFDVEVEEFSKDDFAVKLKKNSSGENILEEKNDGYIVVISSEMMGVGDEEFSKTLLENFIYALREDETPPKYIIFYNTGVKVVVENKNVEDDLLKLIENGAEILSCGLCLDYYNLKESLKIGGVTNMYKIFSLMKDYKVVKPC